MSDDPVGRSPSQTDTLTEGTAGSAGAGSPEPFVDGQGGPAHLDPPGAPVHHVVTESPTTPASNEAASTEAMPTDATTPETTPGEAVSGESGSSNTRLDSAPAQPVRADPSPPITPGDLTPAPVKKEAPPKAAVAVEEFVEEPEEGSPAWMMTFGDMMSLLLTFFILMFSMSTIEVEKFKAAAGSLREALGEANSGVLPGADAAVDLPRPPGEVRTEIVDQELENVTERLTEFVRENDLEDHVVVSSGEDGVYLRMQNQALFGPGSADIAAASVAIVEQLGSMLDQIDLPVKVSGHTDNIPIRSAVYPSNWELSAARAAGVARIMVARGHDASVISVEAYGEHRPVATNDTAEGRSQNRRVELHFARTAVETALDERGLLPSLDGAVSGDTAPEAGVTPSRVSTEGEALGDESAEGARDE